MRRAVRLLDAESVRPYQAAMYCAFIVAGAQNLILGAPPGAVTQAMGHRVALAWSLLLIACPLATLVGLRLGRLGLPAGLWMQIAGDAGVAFASFAYVAAVLQATWGNRASFAVWLGAGIGVCAVAMLATDVRRVRHATRLAKERDRE